MLLKSYCGDSVIWDDKFFDRPWPRLTDCFQDVVLTSVACGWLWLTSIVHILYLRKHKQYIQLFSSSVYIAKQVFSLCLVIFSTIDMIYPIRSEIMGQDVYPSKVVSHTLWPVTFIYTGVLQKMSQNSGVNSPCILFIFWTMSLVFHVVPVYNGAMTKAYDEDIFEFSITCVILALLFIQFILQCCGEKKFTLLHPPKSDHISPSVGSSYPSRLFFRWVFGMIYMGYKKTAKVVDLPELPPFMECQSFVPKFIQLLSQETKIIANQRKIPQQLESKESLYDIDFQADTITEKTSLLGSGAFEKVEGTPYPLPVEKKLGLYTMLLKIFYIPLIKSQVVGLIADLLKYVNPILLGLIIDFVSNKEKYEQWRGLAIAISFFVVVLVSSTMINFRIYYSANIGAQVRSALTAAVYKKSLNMSADSRQKFTVGMTVNLISVDCMRFQDLTTSLWSVISCPVQLIIGFYMIYNQLGISFLAGFAVLLFLLPTNAKLTNLSKQCQTARIGYTDQRVKMMNEILNGIRVLKVYAWETSFKQKIAEIRQLEMRELRKAAILQAINTLLWTLSPLFMSLASFVLYVFLSPDKALTATQAFVSLNIFNMVKQPMNAIPSLINSFIMCHVSMKRLRSYLSGDDLEDQDQSFASDAYPIVMKNGTYSWIRGQPATLKGVDLKIPQGRLVAVVGRVGSGKSSLLSALLGEMNRVDGGASIQGSVGYVPQQAWIQNKSLKDNILFGKADDKSLYKKVIKACALESDIKLLPGGEKTEIGEKGINLSGGQKQRVSLARALYQEKDVILFDDPLSAVDAHVGKHIFDNVIGPQGITSNKTRILVTHGINWLPMVDLIVTLDNGQIVETGSYDELMNRKGAFSEFVKTYLLNKPDDDVDDPTVSIDEDSDGPIFDYNVYADKSFNLHRTLSTISEGEHSVLSAPEDLSLLLTDISLEEESCLSSDLSNNLIQEERTETGQVKWAVYLMMLRAFGWLFVGIVGGLLVLTTGFGIGNSIWLSEWTSDSFLNNASNNVYPEFMDRTEFYVGIYGVLGFTQALCNVVYVILLRTQFLKASANLHNKMLDSILHQNMAYFDTTPSGRILNRFSRDVNVTDSTLPQLLRMVITHVMNIATIIVVITYVAAIFLAFLFPIFIAYFLFQKFYIPSSRQFRRLDSTTKSPIISHFAETIGGASCIRAFKLGDWFYGTVLDMIDVNNKCSYANLSCSRWLRVGLEMLGNMIILFAALFAVLSDGISPSLVGLSVSYALQITGTLNLLVQSSTNLETNAVSLERQVEYSSLPWEPSWSIESAQPSSDWPQRGEIKFIDFSTRYRPGLELVLKNLSFTINPSEKIGIVGRTGSGKSSLSLALFRMIEPADGSILIDGVDISTLGLHDLRSQLTILPQDPVLFSESLRFNLDPFNNHTDDELWHALDNAHLGDWVRGQPDGLAFFCEEGGQNLSVGQRQLLCLARSLLRKTKILVLDEATAAVDLETDHLLQQTIREAFRECTVFTVAHRLNTVMDYDRILVMSAGEIKEFDTPANLLANEKGIFYSLAQESALVN